MSDSPERQWPLTETLVVVRNYTDEPQRLTVEPEGSLYELTEDQQIVVMSDRSMAIPIQVSFEVDNEGKALVSIWTNCSVDSVVEKV